MAEWTELSTTLFPLSLPAAQPCTVQASAENTWKHDWGIPREEPFHEATWFISLVFLSGRQVLSCLMIQ